MCCVCECYKDKGGIAVMDVTLVDNNLASTLCKYDLKKGDLFALSWAVVEDSGFSLGVFKYVVCLCKGCCIFCLYCEAWSCR